MQADIDRFVDEGSLDDNVESFLSPDDADPRDRVGRLAEVSKGMMNVDFLYFCVPWHVCTEKGGRRENFTELELLDIMLFVLCKLFPRF